MSILEVSEICCNRSTFFWCWEIWEISEAVLVVDWLRLVMVFGDSTSLVSGVGGSGGSVVDF